MIADVTLMNLVAWMVQVALVVLVAGVLPRVTGMKDARVRHRYWRALLLLCLLLPWGQPWRPAAAAPDVASIDAPAPAVAPGVTSNAAALAPVPPERTSSAFPWSSLLVAVAMGIALLRVAWLAAGITRLARLRRAAERRGVVPEASDLEGLDTTGAGIYYAAGIHQPVTFGIRRATICLPDSLRAKPPGMRRVVIAHELWHVRRRDWGWLVAEELLRSALWFHPAIVWLISRIQQTREEVVDRLTVGQTNAKRTYLEALLAFADEPAPLAVAAFARRRHLVHRIGLLSREAVMSSKRVVAFVAVVVAVVAITSVYAATKFPLTASVSAAGTPPAPQLPPRDPKPASATAASDKEAALKAAIAQQPGAPGPYLELARLQEDRGAYGDAEATLAAARDAVPRNTTLLRGVAGFYNRQGNFAKTMEALEAVAEVDPSDPLRHQTVATYYWEKAYKDQRISASDKQEYLEKGIAATDRALALDPKYADALAYKNLLLRLRAQTESDPARRADLLAQADALRTQAMEIKKSTMPPPPPPPPPAPPRQDPGVREGASSEAPIRVGGDIKPPQKLKDVKPAYPQAALDARASGAVIVEATVGPSGTVQDARVVRSIPLFDEAALEAVRQWEFEPTYVNGRAVPVIVTVTVNFSLQ